MNNPHALPPSVVFKEKSKFLANIVFTHFVGASIISLIYYFQYLTKPIDHESLFLIFSVVLLFITAYFGVVSALITLTTMNFLVIFDARLFEVSTGDLLTPWQLILLITYQLIITILHLHKRTKYEHAIKKTKKLEFILNNSINPIILKNKDSTITFATNSVTKILSYPPKKLLGTSIEKLIHPFDVPKYQHLIRATFKTPGEIQSMNLRLKKINGQWAWYKNEVVNYTHINEIKSLISTFSDITDQIKLDKQRIESIKKETIARAEAESAVQLRDKFLSVASHELKTPLTTILLHLRATLKRIMTESIADFSGEKLVKSLKVAENQSERLTTMVKDLLNVSLVSTGRIGIEPHHIKLHIVIKELVTAFKPQFTKHKIQFTLKIKSEVEGDWDQVRVEQILTNLLSNAIKYGDNKPIKIILDKSEDFAIIQVIDHGMGIPEAEKEKIFELFHRSTKTIDKKGLGVGLYISKKIATSHGGDLTMTANKTQGTTFTLTLPFAPPPPSQPKTD